MATRRLRKKRVDPSRFCEADPQFQEMLARGIEFLSRLAAWHGGEFKKLDGMGQQDRLGIARAMAFASAIKAPGETI